VPITYTEAALGTKLTVPTPHGDTRTIKVPSGTSGGRVLRLRGEGAPRKKGGRGDLLVTTRVEVPDPIQPFPEDETHASYDADAGYFGAPLLSAG
jgi:molecular chaperone DnaJ